MCPGCRSDQSGLHAIIPESVPRCPNVAWMSQCSKRTPCYNTRKCPKVSQCGLDVAVIKADSMLQYPKVSQGVPMWLGCRSDLSGLHAIIPESVPRCPNVSRMSQCSKRTPCYNTRKCPKVSQCGPDVTVFNADSMLYYPKVSQGVPMWLGCRSDQSGLHAIIPESVPRCPNVSWMSQ